MKTRRAWTVAAMITFGALALLHAQELPEVMIHQEVKVISPSPGAADVMFYHQGPGPFTMEDRKSVV